MTLQRAQFQETSEEKIIRIFTNTSGALLLAVTLALVISLRAGVMLVLPQDPIFQISLRTLYWIFAGFGFTAALVCLFSQKTKLKALLVLWLTLNLAVYALGVQWDKPNEAFSAYLSSVADAFNITPNTAFWMAKGICLYLLIGSSAVLLFEGWIYPSRNKKYLAESFKMACPGCGLHIRFARQNLGQQIPCPQCQKTITLHKPDLLKMSCFFCQEHIEFPSHAIGEKISCPHCKMDITLTEPS